MRYLLAILFCFAAFAQRTPRVVDSTAALVALTPSATAPDVIVVATNANTRIQFRYYPAASDSTNTTSPYVYATSTGTGRWKEVRLTGDLTGVTVDGASIDATAKLNITNGTAVNLTGSLTNVTVDGYPARPFRLTHSGLVTSIGAGTLIDAQGNVISVAAQTVTNVASITNYLVVTLSDLTVRSVRRALHSGAVPIGTVVAGTTNITSSAQPHSFRLPADPLYRFKAKLKAGQLVRVCTLGTSLMDMSSGATNISFRNLLFSTGVSSRGLNVTNAVNVTQLRYSQGSTGPHLSAALIGRTVANPESAFTIDSAALGVTLGPVGSSYDSTPPMTAESPLPNTVDLMLIDGYNYGLYLLTYIEAQAKRFAAAGADVIIINSGPNTTTTTYRYDQGPYMKAMCDAHGWAFCDINAFQRAALDAGDTAYFLDGVHQSEVGNEFWAWRILDLINQWEQAPQNGDPARWTTVSTYEMTDNYDRFAPEEFDVIANPARTTGASGQPVLGGSSAGTINPLVLFGGKSSSTTITVLETNEWAIYGHPLMRSLDLMFEVNPQQYVTIDVYGANGATLIKRVEANYASGGYGKQPVVLELLTQAEMITYAANLFGFNSGYTTGAFANAQVRIVNAGTNDLRIIAPVVGTVRHREVDPRDWKRSATGTWLEENNYWAGSQLRVLGNDTVGANVRLNYHGRGIVVLLQQGTAGGTVQAIHDGVSTTIDTYSASSSAYNYYLAAPDVENGNHKWTVASRDHALSLTLTGNSSGTSPSAGYRRFTIVAAYIIE